MKIAIIENVAADADDNDSDFGGGCGEVVDYADYGNFVDDNNDDDDDDVHITASRHYL
jgi:hypothetical protein